MAVTLNSTGITFSNGQTLATSTPTGTITGIQYTAYQSGNFYGYQNEPGGDTQTTGDYLGIYPGYSRVANAHLIVGATYYRSSSYDSRANDGRGQGGAPQDTGVMNWRTMYRTINGL
jgi:hypothetical protein